MGTFLRAAVAGTTLALVAACSTPGPGEAPDGVYDPYEARNRKVHAFNMAAYETLLRRDEDAPARDPNPVVEDFRPVIVNVADTLALPKSVVNQVLQGRLLAASRNTLRFGVNATLGFGGMFDVAGDLMGIREADSGFGETLAVWGVPEGAFVMLPAIGPSTERDTAGRVVDLFLDPLAYVLPPKDYLTVKGVQVTGGVLERAQYADSVDSVLYGSADSYSQLRLIYLQNSRFDLGEPAADPDGPPEDPFALDTEGF